MTYTGGCHCGRVAFEVETDTEISSAMECNCSICSKRGHLLTFVPAAQVRLRTPETDLSSYTFNKHAIRHRFCTVCGVAPFAHASDRQGNPMFAINVRCLEGVDPQALEIKQFDGRSL
ncbi:GFA family protein [Dokdonella soli]|uniref:GFA family protein n=1 Tax=Dokdonella soli TaxID=529810 RepID=A0ABN1IE60_9GAMM